MTPTEVVFLVLFIFFVVFPELGNRIGRGK